MMPAGLQFTPFWAILSFSFRILRLGIPHHLRPVCLSSEVCMIISYDICSLAWALSRKPVFEIHERPPLRPFPALIAYASTGRLAVEVLRTTWSPDERRYTSSMEKRSLPRKHLLRPFVFYICMISSVRPTSPRSNIGKSTFQKAWNFWIGLW